MVRVLNGGGPDDDTLLAHAAAIEPVPFVGHPPVSVRSGADR
jgi:hypothetical protein